MVAPCPDSKGEGARPPRSGGASPLPCLSSNNCTGNREKSWQSLQGHHKKTADLLRKSVLELASVHGVEKIGFLTLTFADHVTDPKEAQRRYHSLRTHVLARRYKHVVRVIERQKSGRLHYHLLVVLDADIRTGCNFNAFASGDYKSAGKSLRDEWAFWRRTAPKYRFGRTELLPVMSTGEGIAKYVGKYVSKHVGQREERDKGVRLVEYTKGARVGSTCFSWFNLHSRLWRAKLKSYAQSHGIESYEQLSSTLGTGWAYFHREAIMASGYEMAVNTQVEADALNIPAELSEGGGFPGRWACGSSPRGNPVERFKTAASLQDLRSEYLSQTAERHPWCVVTEARCASESAGGEAAPPARGGFVIVCKDRVRPEAPVARVSPAPATFSSEGVRRSYAIGNRTMRPCVHEQRLLKGLE